jgi:hypothetical protein
MGEKTNYGEITYNCAHSLVDMPVCEPVFREQAIQEPGYRISLRQSLLGIDKAQISNVS